MARPYSRINLEKESWGGGVRGQGEECERFIGLGRGVRKGMAEEGEKRKKLESRVGSDTKD